MAGIGDYALTSIAFPKRKEIHFDLVQVEKQQANALHLQAGRSKRGRETPQLSRLGSSSKTKPDRICFLHSQKVGEVGAEGVSGCACFSDQRGRAWASLRLSQ